MFCFVFITIQSLSILCNCKSVSYFLLFKRSLRVTCWNRVCNVDFFIKKKIHFLIQYSFASIYIHTYIHTYICIVKPPYKQYYILSYIYISIHTYIHTYVHTCIHMYSQIGHTGNITYSHIKIHTHTHTHNYIYTHTLTYLCLQILCTLTTENTKMAGYQHEDFSKESKYFIYYFPVLPLFLSFLCILLFSLLRAFSYGAIDRRFDP